MSVRSESRAPYHAGAPSEASVEYLRANFPESRLLEAADAIVADRFLRGDGLTSPDASVRFLRSRLGLREHEVFAVAFMDHRHRVIEFEEMFRGTIDGASVWPREVAKRALELNAAALLLSHNHPSGVAEPSAADRDITRRIVEAVGLFDMRVVDHIVVAGTESVSFAQRGLI